MGKSQDNNKRLYCIHGVSMRDVVEKANSHEVQKDDIVQVLKDDSLYFLLYYK